MWLNEDDVFYKKVLKYCAERIYEIIPSEKLKECPTFYNRKISSELLNNILYKDELIDLKYEVRTDTHIYKFINNDNKYRIEFLHIYDNYSQFKFGNIFKVKIKINDNVIDRYYLEELNLKNYYYLIKIINVIINDFLKMKIADVLLFDYDYNNQIYNRFISSIVDDAVDMYEEHLQLSTYTKENYGQYFLIKSL